MTAQPSSPVDEPTTPERGSAARVLPPAPVVTVPAGTAPDAVPSGGVAAASVDTVAPDAVPSDGEGRARTGRPGRFGNPPRGPLLTGLAGSLLMVIGGFGAGGVLIRDPVLTNSALGFWRYGHG